MTHIALARRALGIALVLLQALGELISEERATGASARAEDAREVAQAFGAVAHGEPPIEREHESVNRRGANGRNRRREQVGGHIERAGQTQGTRRLMERAGDVGGAALGRERSAVATHEPRGLVREVVEEQQRAELTAIYERRSAELPF